MSDTPHRDELFQTGEDNFTVGSLGEYIARHLQNREPEDKHNGDSPPPGSPAWYHDVYQYHPTGVPENSGRVLHHLDSQLINSHLERYLPTPSTRYHMMRDRMTEELRALQDELSHYRQFKGGEYHSKMEALETRIALLQAKLKQVDAKLQEINPFQSLYKTFQNWTRQPEESKKPQPPKWTLIPNKNSQLKTEIHEINQELQSLQHIMSQQLHDPCFSPQQLGRLVNQYDANLRKAERLRDQLRSQQSLADRLNDTLGGLITRKPPSQQ